MFSKYGIIKVQYPCTKV